MADTAPPARHRVEWPALTAIAVVLMAALLALSTRYGYHRDELYFRLLGQHLATGYVDQPVGTPALARAATALFGDSVTALRVPAVLCAGLVVVLAGLLARELDGRRVAQVLAALGAATGSFPLIAGHILLTSSVDLPVWLAVSLFAVRALRRDARWWLAAGAAAGVGLLNKELVVLLALGLAVGLLVVGPRRALASRWLWVGVALAVLIGLPSLVYQLGHGVPQFAMAAALRDHDGADNRVLFVPLQLLLVVAVWVAGLVALVRRPQWRAVRCLAVAYPVVAAVTLFGGGRADYTVGLLVVFLAAGCVVVEDAWAGGARRWPVGLAMVASAIISVVISLPVLPVRILGDTPLPAINQTSADTVGWPRYVAQVSAVWRTLPADRRARTTLLAGNYGETGALDRFGRGLPTAYSGQNELYHRGPPPGTATDAIVVGIPLAGVSAYFGHCAVRAHLDNGVGVDTEEQGRLVLLCTARTAPWPTLWPHLHHLD